MDDEVALIGTERETDDDFVGHTRKQLDLPNILSLTFGDKKTKSMLFPHPRPGSPIAYICIQIHMYLSRHVYSRTKAKNGCTFRLHTSLVSIPKMYV